MAHDFTTCKECGKAYDLSLYHNKHHPLVEKMRKERLCFDCACWGEWLSGPKDGAAVINGGLYLAPAPFEQPDGYKTRSQGLRFVMDAESLEGYLAPGIVLRGTVPDRYKEAFPEKYRFVTRDQYKTLREFDSDMCLSKGCFDRYHCLWYRADIAEPDEPWNEIPENYEVGGENCPSFINKDTIYDLP